MVTYPFQLIDINFIDPLSTTLARNRFILNLGYYISRFTILYACISSNIENIIRCLKVFFITYRKLYTFYVDPNYYFNKEVRDFLSSEDITLSYNLSASHKSTSIIKAINKVLKVII